MLKDYIKIKGVDLTDFYQEMERKTKTPLALILNEIAKKRSGIDHFYEHEMFVLAATKVPYASQCIQLFENFENQEALSTAVVMFCLFTLENEEAFLNLMALREDMPEYFEKVDWDYPRDKTKIYDAIGITQEHFDEIKEYVAESIKKLYLKPVSISVCTDILTKKLLDLPTRDRAVALNRILSSAINTATESVVSNLEKHLKDITGFSSPIPETSIPS